MFKDRAFSGCDAHRYVNGAWCLTGIWLGIDGMQRPHHGASAPALSVSDTPAADVKASPSDVPSASFQLPA